MSTFSQASPVNSKIGKAKYLCAEGTRFANRVFEVSNLCRAMLETTKQERRLLVWMHRLPELIASCLLFWFTAVPSLAQTSVQEFRNVLSDQAAFTTEDFLAIERGEVVVRLLPVTDKREVAVCGLVRTQAPSDVSLRAFRMSMTQLSPHSILEIGKFSTPPVLEDLQGLSLEERDIEDLKRCSVGDCKLKMSDAMIERFRREVDWTAPDYRARATSLYRQMLLDYVRDYLKFGDSALIEYRDQSRAVRLDEEFHALLDSSLYINQFAPEFAEYLREFPRLGQTGVENSINWTKIKFGLKPVTLLTHVATYSRRYGGVQQTLLVSKELYANHYFDSSLALTASINIPRSGSTTDSYLLYTNRSRADSLAGSFSRLKRNLVEREAVANLNALLLQTKLNLESGSMNQAGSPLQSGKSKIVGWLFGGTRLLWWLLAIIIALIALLGFRKRYSKGSVSFERNR